MRLGGTLSTGNRSGFARSVVFATTVALGLGLGSGAGATGGSDATKHLWAGTLAGSGHMQVVRGTAAAIAAADNQLGRLSTRVLAYEEEAPVKALTNDPYYPQQYA